MAAMGKAAPGVPLLAVLAVAAMLVLGGRADAALPSQAPPAHEQAMLEALAMPARTPAEIAAREAAIAAARAWGPAEARGLPSDGEVVERVDRLLGLPPADPTLGIGRR